jgi:hypothetical protein
LENNATRLETNATFSAAPQSASNMITLKISKSLAEAIKHDLMRVHPFAFERVGFIFTKLSSSKDGKNAIILATAYEPVSDEDYIDDLNVGARINSAAIRRAMQRGLSTGDGVFHVHIHDHNGKPSLSSTDRRELRPMMQSIRNAAPQSAHGLLVLSRDAAYADVLLPTSSQFQPIPKIIVVGFAMSLLARSVTCPDDRERFSRQSFLGEFAEQDIINYCVGIIGLGGGGSHIAQQLAHVGFSTFSLFDADVVESTNLNRLIGATLVDAEKSASKVEVASRLIKGVNPSARIDAIRSRWQDAPDRLRACDIVFGCVDSFAERRDLEITTRRYLIPYLDIGLDVHKSGEEPPRMAGQVILSMPGELCMSCLGFLTQAKLAREAEQYGAAGPRPQVVWANGVLASSAVGVALDLITDWTQTLRGPVYLSYDSNTCCVQPHKRLAHVQDLRCSHFSLADLGDPTFTRL